MTNPYNEVSVRGTKRSTRARRPKGLTREKRPERLLIGDDELVRNDLVAKELAINERTLNRGDRKGAPFIKIGGVKYRPIRAYHEFLAAHIERKNQPTLRRRQTGAR
jgi:hypothetical protein